MEAQLLEKDYSVAECQPENPALRILQAWCDLHFGKGEAPEFMLCPFCSHQVAPLWQKVLVITDDRGQPLPAPHDLISSKLPDGASVFVYLAWARCPNETCHEILVEVKRNLTDPYSSYVPLKEAWFAVPQHGYERTLDYLVTGHFRDDFLEACRILDDSHRMSAVLSRRILADLLEQYAGLDDYNLATRIDKFISDPAHPSRIRQSLHYLREIGDFAAHTQKDKKDDIGQVLEASREEAEWTLKVVEDLFDYFIIGPERDKAMRLSMDAKLEKAGRKPVKKLSQ